MNPATTVDSYTGSGAANAACASYEALIAPHVRPLRRWVICKLRNVDDAEDVVQQTLMLAFRSLGQFRFEASIGTWLNRIALNVMRQRVRFASYSRTVFTEPRTLEGLSIYDVNQSPHAEFEREQTRVRVRRAIDKLPPLYREVVELRDMRGLSVEETATTLSVSRPAIKSRHHRARRLLESTLKNDSAKRPFRQNETRYAIQ